MSAPEPRQIDERFNARMAVDGRRVQQPRPLTTNTLQELVECRCRERVRSQACVRPTDGPIGLSSVMANETFGRRHDVLPSFSNSICGWRQRASCRPRMRNGWTTPYRTRTHPPCRRELDEGEEHRETMVRVREGIRQATGL